jgi:NAD(P)-dependent dehydrogenase (short-subunit alcohol dehydrogenase family)
VEPTLRSPVSAAVRAALGSFAKLFSQRYANAGLRMNNVLPGWIDTYPIDDVARRSIPAGRPGSADEVARVVGFLASDDASYITGQSLLVDGA